jgi:hypothetical protein
MEEEKHLGFGSNLRHSKEDQEIKQVEEENLNKKMN